jgi:hypothetical protein
LFKKEGKIKAISAILHLRAKCIVCCWHTRFGGIHFCGRWLIAARAKNVEVHHKFTYAMRYANLNKMRELSI